ncbi:MAG TPA: cell division protein FtsA [Alphaproteobacteria bacterium]|nr:cell division protein FtsA [Rhodospirillaceae bacterium]HRJ12626.1 cell division protein FtsA [Alphaproteobacteria bacterium]
MFLSAAHKPKHRTRGSIITALDIGSHKICCLIARLDDQMKPQVIGIGHHLSQGLRSGVVIDVDAAASAIGQAVHAAEQMAGETIEDVIINVSGNHLQSLIHQTTLPLSGEVTEKEIAKALQLSRSEIGKSEQHKLIHAIPMHFAVDDQHGIKDPRGLYGDQLNISVHLIAAATNSVKNLMACVQRKHLEVEGMVAAPFAAGLSALVDDELELGATILDMGGGTTNIGVFQNGHMVFADCIPIGGQHITMDIARGLTTPVAQAERMKTLYGSTIATASDDRELIDVPQVGEDEDGASNHVPRSLLVGIIQPRVEEILELVRERLENSGHHQSAGRRVILTGGASQLQGLRDLTQAMLDKQVRHGRPMRVNGLAESTAGPAFAVAAGLLLYPLQHFSNPDIAVMETVAPTNIFQQMRQWLKENL